MNKRKTLGYWKLDSEMASGGKGYKSHSFSYLRKRGQTSLDMFLLWTPNAELPVGVACPFSLKNWDLLPCILSGVSQLRADSALGHTKHVCTTLLFYLQRCSQQTWVLKWPCATGLSCPWTHWQPGPRRARTGPSGKGLKATSSILGWGATLVLQESLLCHCEQSPSWRFADLGE